MKTNKLIKFAAAMMLCCMFFGCKPEEEKLGTIYGIVTVTGEPLKGIGVSLFVDDALLLKTVTYEDGHYEFSDLKPREYTLKIETEGYNTFSTTVMVEAGRQARADMQLTLVETGLNVITYEAVVSGNAALLKGHYRYNYSSDRPDEKGFYYSTSTPVTNGTKVKTNDAESTSGGYDFKVDVPDLMPGTYYLQAYAKNSKGTSFGDIKTFVISGDPFVKTLDATNVLQNTATLNGEIVFAGNPAFTERGFVYSRSFTNPSIDDPETSTTRKIVSGTSTLFSANIDNLTNNVTYHVRAYVTNANGTVYGESVEFKTADPNANIISIPTLGLMIQKYDISSGANWSTAKSLCENSTVGGYSDWRLPTKGELQSLYSYGVSVNWNTNSVGYFYHNSDSDSKYWSGTTSSSPSYPYYYVKMYNGADDYESGVNTYRVRAVRNL